MEIDTREPEGNVFAIMGVVAKLLKKTGRANEVDSVMERMQSSDYANACKVATEISYGSITFVGLDEDE